MNDHIKHLAEQFRAACKNMGESEELVLQRLLHRRHISRDVNEEFEAQLSFGDRVADKIAAFGGSWTFIIIAVGLLVFWIVLNAYFLWRVGHKPFDPFPFILLNLVLSMLAALQAPVIMMSQNRQAAKDRLDAEHDYEVNLKAEMEILALHAKLDYLKEQQWAELVAMQQRQIELLTKLLAEKERAG